MERIPYPPADSFPPELPPANMLRMWSHSPATLRPGLGLGTACITALSISPALREALALYCSVKFDCDYIWTRHTDDAKNAGLTEDHFRALKDRNIQSLQVWSEQEVAFLVFLNDVIDKPEASDEALNEARKWFDDRQVVEIITAQGFYYMWARIATTLRVGLDTGLEGDDRKAKQWATGS
ncbi:carboxymuconolactone decarboxylase family domain-containing protein [Purpureocillium lavendulum]|uniref:Carboxymuconolactone decarboxylase family domain-containing protein n=1 Tax=Purpureocillium lavendulum TaxID=1247861 RepID=A0AB34FWC7_9HYPO|nr:carboxymuconolactone decarboxylase family domain-containing protein [Purpureocillium lavendulum]